MNKFKLADLPPKYQEKATRLVSRELGRGNGPTVSPTPPDVADLTERVYTRWYRTASKGSGIVPVEVTASGKGWLDIVTPTGAIQRTRTDGADSYHADYKSAYFTVYNRLEADREKAEAAIREFSRRNKLP